MEMRIDGFWGDYNATGTGGHGKVERREIPHIRRPTLSHERKRKKKPACCVRNDKRGVGAKRAGQDPPDRKEKTGAPAVAGALCLD